MGKKIKYPVGIQTFSEIIEEGYFYVDKTQLVYELANDSKYVFLSRPRRFGKSLLMSTLEAYFKGREELFKGLAMEKLEKDWIEYPVFRFDLSSENYIDTSRLIENIGFYLDNVEFLYDLTSSGSIATRFKQLILKAYRKYGKKVVILIDEYDKPMLDCLHRTELQESIKDELRSFYSCMKTCDEYIRFAMLTGVSKFGKVSVFSGLNNLLDVSLLPKYNALCGIAESEFKGQFHESIRLFADATNESEEMAWSQFKNLYDGYHFAKSGEFIYNPFSVLSALQTNEFKSFWYSTGSSTYLIRLIEKNSYILDKLDGVCRTEDQLSNITDMDNDFIPLLFQAGYLTIKGYDSDSKEYTLGFPNLEVYEAFWTSLKNHFFRLPYGAGNAFDLRLFLKDIHEGKVDGFMERLQALFADTSSVPERNKEIHFQNMMAIVAKMLGLKVHTEVHSSAGRCDMQILTDRFVYIFEFKINGSAEEALLQIYDKGYHLPFSADERTIFLIGVEFSLEKRTINDWKVKIEN